MLDDRCPVERVGTQGHPRLDGELIFHRRRLALGQGYLGIVTIEELTGPGYALTPNGFMATDNACGVRHRLAGQVIVLLQSLVKVKLGGSLSN